MPSLPHLEIVGRLAPAILIDDIGEGNTADWPEPAYGGSRSAAGKYRYTAPEIAFISWIGLRGAVPNDRNRRRIRNWRSLAFRKRRRALEISSHLTPRWRGMDSNYRFRVARR